jgi:phosphoglycerate dehydrogenase-like enzyme
LWQVGIIGLGNIGHMLADMCAALGMNIIYTSRHRKDVPYEHVALDELYARADCVVLTCPLTQETKGMINREAISRMKDGVVLVNVGA